MEETDFWLKLSRSCEEAGVLDQDPLLVYGEKTERTRLHGRLRAADPQGGPR